MRLIMRGILFAALPLVLAGCAPERVAMAPPVTPTLLFNPPWSVPVATVPRYPWPVTPNPSQAPVMVTTTTTFTDQAGLIQFGGGLNQSELATRNHWEVRQGFDYR